MAEQATTNCVENHEYKQTLLPFKYQVSLTAVRSLTVIHVAFHPRTQDIDMHEETTNKPHKKFYLRRLWVGGKVHQVNVLVDKTAGKRQLICKAVL